jgi:methylase of polypeptide subunit release factors
MALVSGVEGTEFLRRIAAEAPDWLGSGGVVACEIGETQREAVESMFGERFERVEILTDLNERDRFVVAG